METNESIDNADDGIVTVTSSDFAHELHETLLLQHAAKAAARGGQPLAKE